jgi:hypothetical protein
MMLQATPERIEALNRFIEEREAIRIKKEAGEPRPWTTDPIFQQFKFCNVHREDDRTTRWITKNWRNPHRYDPDLWFAMVIARRALNWPPSMEDLGYPVPWDSFFFMDVMNTRTRRGIKCFDTAYQLLVQGKQGSKIDNMVTYILDPLWDNRNEIRPRFEDTLRSFFDRLSAFKYMGLFYTGQVIADLKYVQLTSAPDWDTFAVPGPGSERGLNRVLGRDKKTPWREKDWLESLVELRKSIRIPMHSQDLQNCLCEFDKYERVRLGESRVRPYNPTV